MPIRLSASAAQEYLFAVVGSIRDSLFEGVDASGAMAVPATARIPGCADGVGQHGASVRDVLARRAGQDFLGRGFHDGQIMTRDRGLQRA